MKESPNILNYFTMFIGNKWVELIFNHIIEVENLTNQSVFATLGSKLANQWLELSCSLNTSR